MCEVHIFPKRRTVTVRSVKEGIDWIEGVHFTLDDSGYFQCIALPDGISTIWVEDENGGGFAALHDPEITINALPARRSE